MSIVHRIKRFLSKNLNINFPTAVRVYRQTQHWEVRHPLPPTHPPPLPRYAAGLQQASNIKYSIDKFQSDVIADILDDNIKVPTQLDPCSKLNVDNWNDNCEAKSEAKRPRPLRGLQVDSSLTRNVPYAVCR